MTGSGVVIEARVDRAGPVQRHGERSGNPLRRSTRRDGRYVSPVLPPPCAGGRPYLIEALAVTDRSDAQRRAMECGDKCARLRVLAAHRRGRYSTADVARPGTLKRRIDSGVKQLPTAHWTGELASKASSSPLTIADATPPKSE